MPSPERMTRPSEYQPAGRSAAERWDKQVRAVGNQAVDTLVEQAPPGTHAVPRIDCDGIAGRLRDRHVGAAGAPPVEMQRSEERRVGKECVRTCRSRWSP